MFLYLNRESSQTIRVTASEGRGALPEAVIKFRHIGTGEEILLEKPNVGQFPERYDAFQIEPEDIEALPAGDLLYFIQAAPGGDIDPDILLESGRARIRESFTETTTIYSRQTEDVIYERQ